jgi:hypothetical protein
MRLITVLLAVAVAALVAVYVFTRPGQSNGDGYMEAEQAPLITALPGRFKVKPDDPRGLDVEGQDQTIYAAGAGIEDSSDINLGAAPETPMARPGTGAVRTTPEPDAPARNLLPPAMRAPPGVGLAAEPAAIADAAALPAPAAVRSVPPAASAAPPPAKAATLPTPTLPKAAAGAAGKIVQLGAFSSRARAETEWARLAARHGMLGFSPRYLPTERGGQTLWRLRASGGDAAGLCARLAAAGDTCTVVSE